MQIDLNKTTLKELFLQPISKVVGDDSANKGCILDLDSNRIQCLCNTTDGNIILQAVLFQPNSTPSPVNLNIFDLRKFIKILDCVPEQNVKFDINSNNISYTSPTLKFKFHLMDEGVIKKSVINTDKINKLVFDTEFTISDDKIDEINRLATFTEESNKIYLYCDSGKVFGELTDKTKPNIDNAVVQMSEGFTGNAFTFIPLSMDVLRKFSGIKFDVINVKINTQTKVFLFELISNNCTLKYISTALVK